MTILKLILVFKEKIKKHRGQKPWKGELEGHSLGSYTICSRVYDEEHKIIILIVVLYFGRAIAYLISFKGAFGEKNWKTLK